jgi:MinD superfamily P-loop ATPase
VKRELVVLSGKGGTGKTSLVASFAALAAAEAEPGCAPITVDCDVDAADLHLVLQPRILRRELFPGGRKARFRAEACSSCGRCLTLCRFDAIREDAATGRPIIDEVGCEGCGVCAWFCPEEAIGFEERVAGEWFISETRCGPLVHARLGIAEENSGKLVTRLRKESARMADEVAAETGVRPLVLVDGSPGIGCPVIASLTGATFALFVVEPTPSGLHDAERVAELASGLGVPGAICVNKWDLEPERAAAAEALARRRGLAFLGRIPYDAAVTDAQVAGRSVVEFSGPDGPAAAAIREIWTHLRRLLAGVPAPAAWEP